ncbi:MAG: methylenetetrahydrofolate reductase [Actinomycetota bacterium]|nr:methylenetetrahydrofolate reductase [Actinomycetota bacterium]
MKAASNLERILSEGKFAVTAELGPPKGADAGKVREKARLLKGSCDAANITDCQTAIVRMSSIASGKIIMDEGLEPIVQMTTRDRNRIGLQSDLLGAAALGVKDVLCLTGDHPKFGNHPQAKPVFDLDSAQLSVMLKKMRDEKVFLNGEELHGGPEFYIGAVANPFADPFEYRAMRMAKKIEAGADFIQTQIIYNIDKFTEWMSQVRELGLDKKIHILAGVAPVKSAGMAKYMKKNVPGMDVPDWVIERMEAAGKEGAKEEGIKICVEIINKVKEIEGVHGVHIMAIEWEEAVPVIAEAAHLLPRPKI